MMRENNAYFTTESYPKRASTAFEVGMFVAWDGAGAVRPATATTPASEIVGIVKQAALATDTSNSAILISVPESSMANIRCETVNGVLEAADIGGLFDLTNANEVNVAASAIDVVRCVQVISATEGVFKLNR